MEIHDLLLTKSYAMKKIFFQFDNVEEYSKFYKEYTERGFTVTVETGFTLMLSIDNSEIAWITITGTSEFEKDMRKQHPEGYKPETLIA